MQAAFDTIKSFLALGGPVVAILLAVSVLALALVILKLWQFITCSTGNGRVAQRFVARLKADRVPADLMAYQKQKSAACGAVALAYSLKARGDMDKAAIEEEVGQYAATRLHELQSGFRLLDAIAQLAPLLGLFGTVLGMIDAFQQLQGAGSNVDPSLLAGGIWVALLTTAAGLAVAMPVSLILTLLETRIENERMIIETQVGALLSPRAERGAVEASTAHGRVRAAYAG
ncbi:MotA/TolQ/ExbB proton channel family protein [Rhizobium sp. L1K21]|uniref:MotA/TolQ/ExbB proton channel family protein n=1 Tax=Rhizobium sp. L1K21 TaxID=2954933 RepID=UPI00209272F7|nr:MotA/TolQ/ExbB proton channel family protein [Rhizobium sp. L1K21]MCO6185253.1 MotA/TolQ/ExbB proton channel family protein [Rhizobium sp. L1K21]